MHKTMIRQTLPFQREAEVFPSSSLAELIFKARYGEKSRIDPDDIKVIKEELRYTAVRVIRGIANHAGNKELPLSEGNVPTMLLSTKFLATLNIGGKNEDQILERFAREFKGLVAGYEKPMSVDNEHELTVDHKGELILRRRHHVPPFRPGPQAAYA